MKKQLLLTRMLLLVALLVGSVSYGWADEALYYTLNGTITATGNAYASATTLIQDDITWDVVANTETNPWRVGGKSITDQDREIKSKTAMGSAITKVTVDVGATGSGLTVNSIKLVVASDNSFNTKLDEITKTSDLVSTTLTFTPTSGTEWATGAYYKIVFNVTRTSSSGNGYVTFENAKFYNDDSGSTTTVKTPSFSPVAGAVAEGTTVTISSETTGSTIYYTTDGETPTTSSSHGTAGAASATVTVNSDMTIKAIAFKDGLTNSAIASATYTVIAPIPGLAINFEASSLSQYTDWEFNNVGIHTSTITAHGGQKYGSNVNNNDNATTTAYIKTKNKIEHPGFFTCYISKESNNSTSSTWYVQISEDGTDWTDVESASAASMTKGNWNEFTADLSEYSNVYVCLYYDGSNAKRAVDDIVLTESDAIKVTTAGLATYASGKALDFSGVTGIKAYRASISDKTITFNKVDKVPAGEGMLIRAMSNLDAEETFYVPQMVTNPSSIDNAMKRGEGTAVAYHPSDNIYNYVLSGGDNGVGFYRANGETVPTDRAYLQSETALAKGFVINYDDEEGEETDGIRLIENSELRIENSDYYNLAGQRVGKDYKGIVIVNGKKMLNK